MPLDIIVGAQWGDEGKGRIVDLMAESADYVARYNGGDNAGHTVTVSEQTFRLHLIPSGIVHPHTIGAIGNGMVINPGILLDEMETLESAGIDVSPQRLRLSFAAHLITPAHLALDRAQESLKGDSKIGTTLRGIGPAYTSKVTRQGLRLGEMLDLRTFSGKVASHTEDMNRYLVGVYGVEPLDPEMIASQFSNFARTLSPHITDVSTLLAGALASGKRLLAEGAQGTLLDLDHGTYPYVTSSNPTAAGALVGLGLGVGHVDRVIGVAKAFQTRVGSGPFPTELQEDIALHLRGTGDQPWDEYGTTTGRPRRVGWLDTVLLRYSARINGLTELVITKLDVLSGLDPLYICTAYKKNGEIYSELPLGPGDLSQFEPVYSRLDGWKDDLRLARRWEDLPPAARSYILKIEEQCNLPVRLVSVGPERGQIVTPV